jgi:Transposase C of IS166 homeodomain/IS66 Orf2 like protein
MIDVAAGTRVLVATKPVDFRRGADSLAALVREQLRHDPFSGTNSALTTARESDPILRVSEIAPQLPTDIEALHALLAAARAERDAAIAERDQALSQIDRLRHLLRQLQRAQFGRRSEKLDPEQLLLALEDIEQAIAADEAADDKKDAMAAKARAEKRRANRGALAAHLALTFASRPAAAQQYTPQQRAACEPDAMRLCQQYVSDIDRVRACMSHYRRYLSPACRAVFEGGMKKKARRFRR